VKKELAQVDKEINNLVDILAAQGKAAYR